MRVSSSGSMTANSFPVSSWSFLNHVTEGRRLPSATHGSSRSLDSSSMMWLSRWNSKILAWTVNVLKCWCFTFDDRLLEIIKQIHCHSASCLCVHITTASTMATAVYITMATHLWRWRRNERLRGPRHWWLCTCKVQNPLPVQSPGTNSVHLPGTPCPHSLLTWSVLSGCLLLEFQVNVVIIA